MADLRGALPPGPTDTVEIQGLVGVGRRQQVAGCGWIEGAADDADAH